MGREKRTRDEVTAERVRDIRIQSGLTVAQFGAVQGVSQATQSRIENAEVVVDTTYLKLLMRQFNVDANEFLKDDAKAVRDAQKRTAQQVALDQSRSIERDAKLKRAA